MNLQNLREHYGELISFMEKNGYSEHYVRLFREEIRHILSHAEGSRWESYRDIYLDYLKSPHSENYLRSKRTIIGALEQFDIFGRFPDGRRRHSLFERGAYHLLEPEFQQLIDLYCQYEKQRGKKQTTIRGESNNAASFLLKMQEQGAGSLQDITEDAVLSFFVSEEGALLKSCSYKKNIAAVFKAGLKWKETQCRRILALLPMLREARKNIQYLTADEISALRDAAEQSMSMRNRAILLLLVFTGLRGCDIAALMLDAIDWKKETILISQQKTAAPVELPLSAVVGNAIYDYLAGERPDTDDGHVFLSETRPFSPLASRSIGSIVAKIFKAAGVRQDPGSRKGTHIFRTTWHPLCWKTGCPSL